MFMVLGKVYFYWWNFALRILPDGSPSPILVSLLNFEISANLPIRNVNSDIDIIVYEYLSNDLNRALLSSSPN